MKGLVCFRLDILLPKPVGKIEKKKRKKNILTPDGPSMFRTEGADDEENNNIKKSNRLDQKLGRFRRLKNKKNGHI